MASPRPAPSVVTVAAVVAALAVLAVTACDTDDGRTLRPPPPGVTAPELPTSSTATTAVAVIGPPVGSEEQPAFAIGSPEFAPGTAIPARFSCDGDDVSPPLQWEGVPPGTVELALIVRDPDAPGGEFLHWVLARIDPVVTGLGAGGLPETAVEVRPWTGPCPPRGETHGYVFDLFALLTPSGVVETDDVAAAVAAIEATPGERASFTAPYGRSDGE